MVKYKFIDDLTSDVMFEAYGSTLEELFANAAEALFSVICEVSKVEAKEEKAVSISADTAEKLVVAWLQELISIVDIDGLFFSKFKVERVEEIKNKGKSGKPWRMNAKIYGEPVSPEKGGTVVKAVTRYGFIFAKDKKGYKVRVSLDI